MIRLWFIVVLTFFATIGFVSWLVGFRLSDRVITSVLMVVAIVSAAFFFYASSPKRNRHD